MEKLDIPTSATVSPASQDSPRREEACLAPMLSVEEEIDKFETALQHLSPTTKTLLNQYEVAVVGAYWLRDSPVFILQYGTFFVELESYQIDRHALRVLTRARNVNAIVGLCKRTPKKSTNPYTFFSTPK